MAQIDIMTLADDLALSQDQILQGQQSLDDKQIYLAIDSLHVLKKPIKAYFSMSEDQYYQTESDHLLTLLNLDQKLTQLHDRILTNHVDGYVDKDEINLTYNHEDPYEDGSYDKNTDYHVLTYSLKIIGAVQAIAAQDLQKVLSKDAVLSLGLATYALKQNV